MSAIWQRTTRAVTTTESSPRWRRSSWALSRIRGNAHSICAPVRLMLRMSIGAGTLTSPDSRPRISVRGASRLSGLIGGHYTMPPAWYDGSLLPLADTMTMNERSVPTYQNLIGGEWVPAASGEVFENRNPADTGDLIGYFAKSSRTDAERAVDAAARAFEPWRLVPAPKRAEILYRAAQLLVERKERLARDMTREMGKVLEEARGDVQEAIDMAFFMAGEGRRQHGQTAPSELRDKFAMSIRQPIGVCGIITPWNFPMAIPSWKILPALVCGDTVVLKPATLTPLSAWNFVKVLEDAGLPPGVSTSSPAAAATSATRCSSRRWSASCRSRARPRSAARSARRRPRPSRRSTWKWAARTSSSSWTTPTWRWRLTGACGAGSGQRGSDARRRAAWPCTGRSTRRSWTSTSSRCGR